VSAGRSVNLIAISDLLFRSQVVTIPRIAEHLGVQYRSAQLNLESLLKVGILEEVEGTVNPRYFPAREIRDVINESLRPEAEEQLTSLTVHTFHNSCDP
jgi:predicted DNA-binding transcriptional regulator